jgi:hypothetical protein
MAQLSICQKYGEVTSTGNKNGITRSTVHQIQLIIFVSEHVSKHFLSRDLFGAATQQTSSERSVQLPKQQLS